jgi:hypothetical protein
LFKLPTLLFTTRRWQRKLPNKKSDPETRDIMVIAEVAASACPSLWNVD